MNYTGRDYLPAGSNKPKNKQTDIQPRSDWGTGEVHVKMTELLDAFSAALDLMDPSLSGHHTKTCFVACSIADQMRYSDYDKSNLFSAALLHDIGAVAHSNIQEDLIEETGDPHLHAELGYVLLRQFAPFASFASLVRHHHVKWENGAGQRFKGREVDELCHLLHLADRVAVLSQERKPGQEWPETAIDRIKLGSGEIYKPEQVEAFLEIAAHPAFWLDLDQNNLSGMVLQMSAAPTVSLDLSGMMKFAKFYSRLVDTRSRFTSSHSSGVAAAAGGMAEIMGLDYQTAQKLRIAGYLHDIGKLAVPQEILEKNGELSREERKIVMAHSYHTKRILERVAAFADIAEWAANHHETPAGDGYPFGATKADLDIESRILAVADIFTALREKRPYRTEMSVAQTKKILCDQAEQDHLDRDVVRLFCSHFSELDQAQQIAQDEEVRDLNFFWGTVRKTISFPAAHFN